MHRYSFLILIIIFFVASCVKPPDYPIEPRIEFVSMNANTFDELDEDSLSVVIYFEDGDGDLGSDDSVKCLLSPAVVCSPRCSRSRSCISSATEA